MQQPSKPTYRKRRHPNAGLFNGYWFDLSGKKLGRLRRNEYPELYRLWREHADIRTGKHPAVYQGLQPVGVRSVLHMERSTSG